jgi:hypothetical protein
MSHASAGSKVLTSCREQWRNRPAGGASAVMRAVAEELIFEARLTCIVNG